MRRHTEPAWDDDIAGKECTYNGVPCKVVRIHDGDRDWPHVISIDLDAGIDVQYSFAAVRRILAAGGRFGKG